MSAQFILFDHAAAHAIIVDRFLQSVDFDQGYALADLLQSPSTPHQPVSSKLGFVQEAGGLYVLGVPSDERHYVVFDLTQADPFNIIDGDCLLILQRVLRCAVRLWEHMAMSSHDRLIAESTKVAIFPFPMKPYRVMAERLPASDESNSAEGNHLLIYKYGWDRGEGGDERVDTTIFYHARDHLEGARSTLQALDTGAVAQSPKAFEVTALDELPGSSISPHIGFDTWLHKLTVTQREFVLRIPTKPERIEGAAGTGKTLSLVLKCINAARDASRAERDFHAIFITYGDAMKRVVEELFDSNDSGELHRRSRTEFRQTVAISTLQGWCGKLLQSAISESEFLDRDAMEARDTRLLYVVESVEETAAKELPTLKNFLSSDFLAFLSKEEAWTVAEMVQHEIAVMIKGRAGEDLERYRRLPYLTNNLPLRSDSDKGYVFAIFRTYQRKLEAVAQFDTDDVVLSAIGQLDTPIWRRRRATEAFDAVFVDEAHLFNVNELSIMHYLTRTESQIPIIFSVDRAQAPGDRGMTQALLDEVVVGKPNKIDPANMRAIFRCSPQITQLALAVTASGATLFTTFDDPLRASSSAFTDTDERKSAQPELYVCPNDEVMAEQAVRHAVSLERGIDCSPAEIVIIAFSNELFSLTERAIKRLGRHVELLKRRGDIDAIQRAKKSGAFLLSTPDYVGGLEFSGAILLGVDQGRVPPISATTTIDSQHFLTFASHARLYVAITRGRYRIVVLASQERGPSRLLDTARKDGFLRGPIEQMI